MSSFFLSYPGVDRDEARALASHLRDKGLRIWCDVFPESLPPGASWPRRLEAALEQADGFLLLVGPGPIEGWVRRELDYALRLQVERERQGRAFPLVPLCRPGAQLGKLSGFIGGFQGLVLAEEPRHLGPEAVGRLVEELRKTLGQGSTARFEVSEEPYPGLEVFDENRAPFFFGRDDEIRELCERLGHTGDGYQRWLQIEGPSGSGKSSLAQAGLLPRVRRGWIAGGPREFQVAVMRPGKRPVLNLAQAVHRALGAAGLPLARVEESLGASDMGLVLLLREHLPAQTGFLLLVDQLEELFTVADEAGQVRELDALLGRMLEDADRPFYLVTTVRSDFLGKYETLPWLGAGLNGASRYQLRAMRGEALRRAIEGPAALVGLRWEQGLPERILEDAARSEGSGPLVAHVLHELWRKREGESLTHKAYQELEGVSGALRKSADAVVDGLGPEAEGLERARRLLLRLVRIRGGEATRQTATRAEVLTAAGGGEQAERVLTRLSGGRDPSRPEGVVGVRLVTVSGQDEESGEDQVDLVHETLLSEWERLRTWVEEHRKVLECRDDLEAAVQGWNAAGSPKEGLPGGAQLAYYRKAEGYGDRARRYLEAAEAEERRRSRRTRRVNAGLSAGLFVALVAGGWAWQQQTLAESRLRDAAETAEQVAMLIGRLEPSEEDAEVRQELLEKTAALQERLLAGARGNEVVLHGLMFSHIRRGDLARSRDDWTLARTEYEAALRVVQKLAEVEEDILHRDGEFSILYGRLGEVAHAAGDLALARSSFEKKLELAKALTDAKPQFVLYRHDLAFSYYWLGKVAQSADDLASARSFLEKGLELTKALSDADPHDTALRNQLLISYQKLGKVAQAAGDLASARSFFEKDLEYTKALADAFPHHSGLGLRLAASHVRLMECASQAKDDSALHIHRNAARQILDRLESEGSIPDKDLFSELRQAVQR